MRQLVLIYGIESLVFIDEAGFEKFASSLYGWSKKGERVYGEKQGKRGKKENLVARKRKMQKDLIAPMLFTGSLNTTGFEGWLKFFLIPTLTMKSILIMDNPPPIHRKNKIREIVESAGHIMLFLPTYSPDLNDIEHDFSALNRARMQATPDTSIDKFIQDHCIV
ncbi:transposase [Synechocystis sp. PCC 6803]|nr:transposase [Synechocystis sp. PCC 6803] [Bacillus subtilis BEST7613]